MDSTGNLHNKGTMRLATAADEILPLKDPRVKSNPAYLTVILLSRVITKLGSLENLNPTIIENLFASDLAYLQDFYSKINESAANEIQAVCPRCGHKFDLEGVEPGE